MQNNSIGIFDSGLGGISVLNSMRSILPNESYIYLADHEFAPYGEKSEAEVRTRCLHIVDYFHERQCKAIVVACNTATALAVEHMRQKSLVPVIGIEPAIKPSVLLNRSGHIGVLATSATLASPRYKALLAHYEDQAVFHNQTGSGLVELIENNYIDSKRTLQLLREYLQPMIDAGTDTLVLGCTHYAFLIPTIQQYFPQIRQIVDPASAVARRAKAVLEEGEMLAERNNPAVLEHLTTGDVDMVNPLVRQLSRGEALFQRMALPAFLDFGEAISA